ncbi:hypothetical protein BDM02DRAFT_3128825 [Thelephora ganbajun]|uniref:Uncharacterized protein n=1 Tax=Thelephora ganbajun TaxID=370292 RepID=A0ACB6ZFY8_THEGA|nr:hypothetical protein BDM02DRAFT_3128825 [Thelephora ganbajun]
MGTDLTLTDLLTVGLVDWEGANQEDDRPKDSMRFAATVAERLLSRLEVVEGLVSTQANSLQLQASGLDTVLTNWSEDRRFLLCKNADLDREVGDLKEVVTRLEGELGVLLARVEALEWTAPSEYLSVEDLLRMGSEGGVAPMDSDEAAALGLRPDFQDLDFDEPHKWSSRSIRYSAVVADRLWSLFEAEQKRNDRVEAELQALKGQVALLNNCLLTVDRFSFDANKKVNTELEKDGVRLNRHRSCLNTLQDKHNALVSFVRGHSSQLELHRRGLLSLRGKMCLCAAPESPIDGSGEAPSFSSLSTPRGGSPAIKMESEDSVVVPPENETPIPVPVPVLVVPAPTPRRTVVESTSTLRPISEEEARAIEDRLVGAWHTGDMGWWIHVPSSGNGQYIHSVPSHVTAMSPLDWEGANQEDDRPKDSMHFAATVAERLLSRLEVVEGLVSTQANSLQLQASGLDTVLTNRSEDRRFLLRKNADLDREVGELKEVVTRLEGELGVLLARVEALEWTAPSEYLSVKDLLRMGGEGGVAPMDSDEAAALGLRPNFQDLPLIPILFLLSLPPVVWFKAETVILSENNIWVKEKPSSQHQDTNKEDYKEDLTKTHRKWHIPDFTLLASPDPRGFESLISTTFAKPSNIYVPQLPEKKVIVPMIIEVKAQSTNSLNGITAQLGIAHAQLHRQVAYLFSDFPWQTEVIAITGCGMYWMWWRFTTSGIQSHKGSPYIPSSSEEQVVQAPGLDTVPFIIGTKTSDSEILKLQRMVSQKVEAQKWELHSNIEQQGVDLEEYWQCLHSRYKATVRGDRDGSGGEDEGGDEDEDEYKDEDKYKYKDEDKYKDKDEDEDEDEDKDKYKDEDEYKDASGRDQGLGSSSDAGDEASTESGPDSETMGLELDAQADPDLVPEEGASASGSSSEEQKRVKKKPRVVPPSHRGQPSNKRKRR